MVANICPMNPAGVQADQRDRAARLAHPDQLVGGGLVVRREHHADAGHDDVELAVGVRQRLRVADLPGDVDALAARPRPGRSRAVRGSGRRPSRRAPVRAAGMAALPEPAATSRTRCPAPSPAASTRIGPKPAMISARRPSSRPAPTSRDAWPSAPGRRRRGRRRVRAEADSMMDVIGDVPPR